MVAELLARGADPNVGDDRMVTPLMHAVAAGHLEATRLLLGAGANADSLGAEGLTVLMRAASAGHADVVQALLEHGVDVDHGDAFGNTALLHAAGGWLGLHWLAAKALVESIVLTFNFVCLRYWTFR